MDYKKTVEYIFNSTPVFEHVGASAYKEGLYNTKALDEHLGHPHRKYKTVHVAGTNGKGSCSHTLAAILQEEGYKVGLYTSPHLVDFRERIRVNGECVSERYVVEFIDRERGFFEPLRPSFFELTTAMAFKYFADQNVDIAVIEVGLGGRLDCTNIISPILSVITNISLDHTQFLGNTLESIAKEKAGIIKEGVPVVIGETLPETKPVFMAKAKGMDSPMYFADDDPEIISTKPAIDGGLTYDTRHFGNELHGELGGLYQARNTNTILRAFNVLRDMGVVNSASSLEKGIANVCELTGLQGRWQTLRHNPTVICDTGHNVGGWVYLAEQLKAQQCTHMRIVFGMVDDKDVDTVMGMLPRYATYYFTNATIKRAIPASKVKEIGDRLGLKGKAYLSVQEAYQAATKDANAQDFIFVGGSGYVVADLLTAL